ncbi:MAG: GAF domain-containing protein [Deltaproteobacteria bacterium]|nr:GAF domain-containing protein [Deltaproteobacteria bacterium]
MGMNRPELNTIEELRAEVERLRSELEQNMERERELEETRKAMLFLLEDINDNAEGLMKAKKEWETTFDSISDLLIIHDNDMRILRCNKAYHQMAGIPFTEIIGKPYNEVFPKTDAPFSTCLMTEKELGMQEEEAEFTIPALNKVFKVRFYSIAKPGTKEENAYIHIMEDITDERRAADKEKVLYNFTQNITANLDLDFRLKAVCEAAVEFGYRMAWIGFPDHASMDIVPMAYAGFEDGYLSEIKVKYDDSQFSNGPVGMAVKSKKSVVFNDIANEENYAYWKEQALKRGFGSIASFPVKEEEKVIASLNIYSTNKEFPEKELSFLQTFANQIGIYLKNAKLFKKVMETSEKMREEMELSKHLLMIASATANTTDIDKLMEQVVNCLQNIIGCNICLSYIWDKERRVFQPTQEVGLPREKVPFFRVEPLDPGVHYIKKALDTRVPILEQFKKTENESEQAIDILPISNGFSLNRLDKDIHSIAVIPLIGREDYLGVLICIASGHSFKFVNGFSERDIEVMDGISHQVSIALDEARLYKESIDKTMELSRKIETIQTMHEIDKSILSTLEPQEILETAAQMIAKIIYCDRATLALVDKEKEGFNLAAGFGLKVLKKGDFVAFKDTSTTDVVKTGRPQYVANINETKLLPLEAAFAKEGFMSHIRVPLTIKGEVIGVFSIGAKRPSAFTSEDLSIAEKLASQISVALENSRLLSDLEELFLGIVKTLSEAIDAKSPWTRGHSERVTKIAIDIGMELGLSQQELKDLELAGLLHDIGKLGTYESILDKPGKLTSEELDIMKRHPNKGADILAPIKQMKNIVPAIKSHHEFYDGNGYPEGLKGREIPFMGRILAVADTVDAMSADRPYRKGKPMDIIISELRRCSGTQFDPGMVDAFLKTIKVKVA